MATRCGGERDRTGNLLGCKRAAIAAVLAVTSLLTGCGDLQNVTSGQIGCAPSDITISDESHGWNVASWVATCNGKRYFCSGISSGRYGGGDVSCKEEQSG